MTELVTDRDRQRSELLVQVLSARTREEVRDAMRAARAWLRRYPDDDVVRDASEQLVHIALVCGFPLDDQTPGANTST